MWDTNKKTFSKQYTALSLSITLQCRKPLPATLQFEFRYSYWGRIGCVISVTCIRRLSDVLVLSGTYSNIFPESSRAMCHAMSRGTFVCERTGITCEILSKHSTVVHCLLAKFAAQYFLFWVRICCLALVKG